MGNVVITKSYKVETREMLLSLVDLFLVIKTLHKSLINFADSFALWFDLKDSEFLPSLLNVDKDFFEK